MLTFAMLKPLGGLLKRLDAQPLLEKLRAIDTSAEGWTDSAGMLVIGHICERLEDVADDVIRLCAGYKGVSYDEAMSLDAISALKEIFAEPGFMDFFKRAALMATPKQ